MTYVVTEKCIRCKYLDCVEVCPVDCFYEGENMLVIHPDECIDCGVCEPECPVDAIRPGHRAGARAVAYAERGICQQMAEHHHQARRSDRRGRLETEEGKFEKYFSPAPGQGD